MDNVIDISLSSRVNTSILPFADTPVLIPSERVLEVGGPKVVSTGRLIPGTEVTVELTITSKLPSDVRWECNLQSP